MLAWLLKNYWWLVLMETGLLHDYFGIFSMQGEKYFFRVEGSMWCGFNAHKVRLKWTLKTNIGGTPYQPDGWAGLGDSQVESGLGWWGQMRSKRETRVGARWGHRVESNESRTRWDFGFLGQIRVGSWRDAATELGPDGSMGQMGDRGWG